MCECGCVLGLMDRRVLRGAETKVAGSSLQIPGAEEQDLLLDVYHKP